MIRVVLTLIVVFTLFMAPVYIYNRINTKPKVSWEENDRLMYRMAWMQAYCTFLKETSKSGYEISPRLLDMRSLLERDSIIFFNENSN